MLVHAVGLADLDADEARVGESLLELTAREREPYMAEPLEAPGGARLKDFMPLFRP